MNSEQNLRGKNKRDDLALRWHVRLHSGSATQDDWLAFTDWLEADTAHNAAYDIVALAWEAAGELAPTQADSTETSSGTSEDNQVSDNTVIAFPFHRLRKAISAKPLAFGGSVGAAIAATLLVLMAPVFLGQNGAPNGISYATGIGEQRTIILADGSTVMLNTNTAITVEIDKKARRVELQHGEALFTVQHETTRSFIVAANALNVTDIGTRFDVRMDTERTLVSVLQGIVDVSLADQADRALLPTPSVQRLIAGQQAIHVAGQHLSVHPFDTARQMAWQQGQLIFENEDLAAVTAEINRYFKTPLMLVDADLGNLRFSGILQITDQNQAVRDLTAFLPLTAQMSGDSILLRRSDIGITQ